MSLSSAARDLLTTLMIGSSLLWEMMLWLSVSVNLKNKAALDAQKGASLGLKWKRHLANMSTPVHQGKVQRQPHGVSKHRNQRQKRPMHN